MFELPFKRTGVVSIDIGFRNIKVVEVEVNKEKEVFVKNFGIVSTPRDCIKNGHVYDADRLSEAIRKVIVDCGIKSNNAKIVMSGTHIVSRVFLVEALQERSIDKVVNDAILQNMPAINLQTHQVDFKILKAYNEKDSQKLKILVTAVLKTIISSYVEVLDALNLKAISVDIPANSVSKFFKNNINVDKSFGVLDARASIADQKDKEDTFAVIDFGSETTIVNVLRDRVLEFNKVIQNGSSNIDEAISAVARVRLSEAELVKKKQGLLMPDNLRDKELSRIHETVKNNIDQTIKQIYQAFDFYEKRCYGSGIDRIYIIGGGALLKGLKDYLQNQLAIPVYLVGLTSIDGVRLNRGLDYEKINFLINSVGITL